ncbi:hypothetical protein BH10ACT1_BH10ACT1_41410 [soil metagenome]
MTAVRSTTPPDRRTVAAFERTTAALGRTTGAPRPPTPLGAELRSSALLLLAVLGLPLLLVLLLAS